MISTKIIKKSLKIACDLFPEVYIKHSQNRNFHFCFVYKRAKLLTIGQNNMQKIDLPTIKLMKKFNVWKKKEYIYKHAEIDAINKLWGKQWIDSSLSFVIIRLNKYKSLQNSKPCDRCSEILKALNITQAYWSNQFGDIVYGEI